ncbi:MAG: endonuclease III domain-containing protein [Candidatus Tectomicrobia bacterium]|uniref:Endonuclease III domain-containing protein n=1 Tax=Tectimicrobiota bacterium TaxID=2528274 RepID=A0A932G020_UNCTE|nr:endonuclease III domain-containing protein [Candidatus Tectomicrobia bacterium]
MSKSSNLARRKKAEPLGDRLEEVYVRLREHFGPQRRGPYGWWPGETAFEVAIGAILTQNTAWQNVEKALARLKARELLTPQALQEIPQEELAALSVPAGYFNVKARRLKTFVGFLWEHSQGNLEALLREDLTILRPRLLGIQGIGPETADSILLYAGGHPIFVVDAYTQRIFSRHRWIREKASYAELQELFLQHLSRDPLLYNEYHGLLVNLGKYHCKRKPLCSTCPLGPDLPAARRKSPWSRSSTP